ncbi:MAG: ACT domain-containing protein [Candidatus Nanoarchaeia archaeon]|nr:ACT domain-containing protein [Candidatus Nanoarchaeia archaeon]MDD5499936.1 ACT domain-containing protein [Candidatus Nanoarchaeia archaeon]
MSIQKTIKKFLREQKVKSILKASKIGATTDLVLFQIKRNSASTEIYDNIKTEFIKSSNHIRGVVGERYISLLANENKQDYIMNAFEGNIISFQKRVACIVMDCSKIDNVSGIITYITSVLAEKNINLHGFFTSQDDITIIIDEEKAFEYVDELKKILKN